MTKTTEQATKQPKETNWGMLREPHIPLKWSVSLLLLAATVTMLSYVLYTYPILCYLSDLPRRILPDTFVVFPIGVVIVAFAFVLFLLFVLPILAGCTTWWLGEIHLNALGIISTDITWAKNPDYLPFLPERITSAVVTVATLTCLATGIGGLAAIITLSDLVVVITALAFWPALVVAVFFVFPNATKGAQRRLEERGTDDLPRHEPLSEAWWGQQKAKPIPSRWPLLDKLFLALGVLVGTAVLLAFLVPLITGGAGMSIPMFILWFLVALAIPLTTKCFLWRREQVKLKEQRFDVEAHKTVNVARGHVTRLNGWLNKVPHSKLVAQVVCIALTATGTVFILLFLILTGAGFLVGALALLFVLTCAYRDGTVQAARDKAVAKGYVDVPAPL